jgi:hypothetical protein
MYLVAVFFSLLFSFSVAATELQPSVPGIQEAVDPAVEQALQVVRSHHLESEDGKISFLEEKLSVFMLESNRLNTEIQDLAKIIQEPSAERSKEDFVASGELLNQKMQQMLQRLPVLEKILKIDEDFAVLNDILTENEFLDEEEKTVLFRIASLCEDIDAYFPPASGS